jgi:hypothetical protein
MRVVRIGLDYAVVEVQAPDGRLVRRVDAPDVNVWLSLGLTFQPWRLRMAECGEPGEWMSTKADWIGNVWANVPHHRAEQEAGTGALRIHGWEASAPGSGRVLARKRYDESGPLLESQGTMAYTEATRLELRHAPDG